MSTVRDSLSTLGSFSCQPVAPTQVVSSLADDVRRGFSQQPRSLPPKYFYDALGSQLFDAICRTPEYYPTRTEAALLRTHAAAIVERWRPDHLLELGSGSARKTQYLLDACDHAARMVQYWPFDVCEHMLRQAGAALLRQYPWLRVNALVGDYTAGLANLPRPPGRRLFLFLGGSIGNFSPDEAQRFLCELRRCMAAGDALLLGLDRVKSPAVLEAAYDDAQGVTAEFNLNLLRVLNRELAADFDRDGFRHRAVYNDAEQRIEMHLLARRTQTVTVGRLGRRYSFRAGEWLLTEISRKFSEASLQAMLQQAELRLLEHFEAPDAAYSLLLIDSGRRAP